MGARRVTCITTINRVSHESITHLGGPGWYLSRDEVVQSIKRGEFAYYTEVDGRRAWLVVRVGYHGQEYVQTEGDSTSRNNLLSLADC